MRFAADTLAPQANAVASRRCVASGPACAGGTFSMWRSTGLHGFAATKPSSPMVTIPVSKAHVANITTRRLSEASP